LEAKVHITTTLVSSAQNVIKCANRCGLEVAAIVLEPLASAEACVEEDEKELGVALIDIGGGTTDIVVYADGAMVHSAVLPLGGFQITNDIAVGLRTPLQAAEGIKRKYGCCLPFMIEDGEMMEVPSVGGREPRQVSRQLLIEKIVQPRIEEIFQHIRQNLTESGYYGQLAAGVVLTGGCTHLEGIAELAETVLDLPARKSSPSDFGGLIDVVSAPEYSTAVGLVKYGARGEDLRLHPIESKHERGVWRRMRGWMTEIF
jgi:cell division protein FtsA